MEMRHIEDGIEKIGYINGCDDETSISSPDIQIDKDTKRECSKHYGWRDRPKAGIKLIGCKNVQVYTKGHEFADWSKVVYVIGCKDMNITEEPKQTVIIGNHESIGIQNDKGEIVSLDKYIDDRILDKVTQLEKHMRDEIKQIRKEMLIMEDDISHDIIRLDDRIDFNTIKMDYMI